MPLFNKVRWYMQEAARLREELQATHAELRLQQRRHSATLFGWQSRWAGVQEAAARQDIHSTKLAAAHDELAARLARCKLDLGSQLAPLDSPGPGKAAEEPMTAQTSKVALGASALAHDAAGAQFEPQIKAFRQESTGTADPKEEALSGHAMHASSSQHVAEPILSSSAPVWPDMHISFAAPLQVDWTTGGSSSSLGVHSATDAGPEQGLAAEDHNNAEDAASAVPGEATRATWDPAAQCPSEQVAAGEAREEQAARALRGAYLERGLLWRALGELDAALRRALADLAEQQLALGGLAEARLRAEDEAARQNRLAQRMQAQLDVQVRSP